MTEAAPAENPSQSKLQERTRVLVVDDEPGVRQVIRVNLVMQGHEVIEAKNGAQALKALEENGIDLVILDLMMPKVSGWDVLEKVSEKRVARSIPIIVLSAVTSEDAKVKAFGLGASDYVVKPFAVGELLARVNRTLHEKKEKQVLAEFSITDWVTGLFNRRYLELRLPQEVSRAHRYGRRLSAIFFEVDQLPWLLEQRGPQFVDGILQEVTSLVRGETRACDILFRYDADYFVALLPDTDVQGGTTVADRIRRRMLDTEWNQEVGLSGSFGVVELEEGEDAGSFLGRAEAALLEAKRAGGNSVWPSGVPTVEYGHEDAQTQDWTQGSPLVEEGPAAPILDQELSPPSTGVSTGGGEGTRWNTDASWTGEGSVETTAGTTAEAAWEGSPPPPYGTDHHQNHAHAAQVAELRELHAGATQQIDPQTLGQIREVLEQDPEGLAESAAYDAQVDERYGAGQYDAYQSQYEAYPEQTGYPQYPADQQALQVPPTEAQGGWQEAEAQDQPWAEYQAYAETRQGEAAAGTPDYGATVSSQWDAAPSSSEWTPQQTPSQSWVEQEPYPAEQEGSGNSRPA